MASSNANANSNNGSNNSNSNNSSSNILAAKETFSTISDISRLLNTGLDVESLALCVRLCENGANPEALATVIREIRKQSQAIKILNVLHNSEQPATVFSVVEPQQGQGQGQGKSVTFASDTLFDLLLLKLSSAYSKRFRVETKGTRFQVGEDFLVKIGIVSSAGSFRGILVEVEYQPCGVPASCWGLLSEFARGFLGSAVPLQMPQYLQQRANELYTPVDTVQQYLEHFNAFRKGGPQQQQQQQQQRQ